MVYTYVDTLVFLGFCIKSVLSINGLSFVSARPTPQPCVPVFMVQGICIFVILDKVNLLCC